MDITNKPRHNSAPEISSGAGIPDSNQAQSISAPAVSASGSKFKKTAKKLGKGAAYAAVAVPVAAVSIPIFIATAAVLTIAGPPTAAAMAAYRRFK